MNWNYFKSYTEELNYTVPIQFCVLDHRLLYIFLFAAMVVRIHRLIQMHLTYTHMRFIDNVKVRLTIVTKLTHTEHPSHNIKTMTFRHIFTLFNWAMCRLHDQWLIIVRIIKCQLLFLNICTYFKTGSKYFF